MRWVTRLLFGLGLALPGQALAFQIETPVTGACHESITLAGARAAGFPSVADVPAPTEEQHRAMDDLTFTLPHRDVWTMALLLGVRSNDLRDNQPIDVARLVHIHNDPDDQPAHCMRKSEHDGQGGDALALAACREFILGELDASGLLDDTLDLEAAEVTPLYLAFRGRVEIALPRFAYRLGRALHALEDGYTHAFRNPDTDAVRHVANWIDSTKIGAYIIEIDGYHHVGVVDDCLRDDARARGRVDRVTAAVTRVLSAIGDPSPGRRARVLAALDRSFQQELGCELANRYCASQELDEEADTGGCSASGDGGRAGLILIVALIAVRRRRRAACGAAILLTTTSLAVAEVRPAWHLDVRVGAALDHAAQATSVGVGRELGHYTVGAMAEWNPWFSIDTSRAQLGAFNIYATIARRWYETPQLVLYSRAEVGTSTILFELVGVDRYETGLYLGASLLGLALRIGPRSAITFDPSHVAAPVPQLSGFPFYYRQYRVTVGIEVALP